MTIELALVISGISLAFAVYFGVSNLKRQERAEMRNSTSEMTTVIVKLENICMGIAEIKAEVDDIKNDTKENWERLIKTEEAVKQAHRRLDTIENYKRPGNSHD